MVTQSGLSSKTLEKTLKKSIKRVLTQKGLSYQRRKGNKELNFLVKKIAQTNLPNLETASKTGEQLGEKIASISEEKGKNFLDVGVLRQIGSLSSVEELWEGSPEKEKPSETTPVSEDVAATETSAAPDEPTSETEESSPEESDQPE